MRPSDFKAHILLVDDEPGNLQLIGSILYPHGVNLSIAQTGQEALTILAHKRPDLILLDITMPEMDGFEVCRRIKADLSTHTIPIIFLTGRHDADNMIAAFQIGAVDYITKPFQTEELLARVVTHLELKQARDRILAQNQQLSAQNAELQRLAALQEQSFATSLSQVENALRESEELHRATLSNISDAVFLTDDAGNFTYVCENVAVIFQRTPAEVAALGNVKTLLQGRLFDPGELRCQGELRNIEWTTSDPAGQTHHLLITVKRVAIGRGSILYTCRDITERKQIEEALRRSEQQYRRLTENVADGIGIIQDGLLVLTNDALSALLKTPVEQLWQKEFTTLIHTSDHSLLHQAYAYVQTGQDTSRWQSLQFRLQPPHQETWIDARYSQIEWEGQPAVVMTMRDITTQKLREREIEQEKSHLHRLDQALRATMRERYKFGEIIGKSAAMQAVYEQMLQAAASGASVIVYGESGTGKELVAWTIHTLSQRRDKTFIPVNCGAIQETLFESEFFGHRKGAFTGAYEDKRGFFDHAQGGTLFLDEVAELTPAMQVKLLRVLSGGEYTPVGDHRVKHANARIIAATNQDFSAFVAQGRVREDFYYRVAVVPIIIPPLRDRREDIPVLLDHFLDQLCEKEHRPTLPGHVLRDLYEYNWPGNVRELQNVLQRYLATKHLDFLAPRRVAEPSHVFDRTILNSPDEPASTTFQATVANFEKQELVQALEQQRWNRTHTAAALGITRRSLFRLMQKHGLFYR